MVQHTSVPQIIQQCVKRNHTFVIHISWPFRECRIYLLTHCSSAAPPSTTLSVHSFSAMVQVCSGKTVFVIIHTNESFIFHWPLNVFVNLHCYILYVCTQVDDPRLRSSHEPEMVTHNPSPSISGTCVLARKSVQNIFNSLPVVVMIDTHGQ